MSDKHTLQTVRRMRAFCKKWGIDYDNVPEKFEFSDGNSKLKPDGIVSFNLIPLVTCPFAGSCAKICYAQCGPQWFRSGKIARVGMFKATLSENFVSRMVALIHARAISRVRFHDSGDFYSPEYLEKFMSVAQNCPGTRFYVYTKSIKWMRDYVAENGLPKNVSVIQSRGGLQDELIGDDFSVANIFPDKKSLLKAGYADTSESDMPALIGKKKIGLIVHGAKKNSYNTENFI